MTYDDGLVENMIGFESFQKIFKNFHILVNKSTRLMAMGLFLTIIRNRPHLGLCVICYGQIPAKTSGLRRPTNTSLTIQSGVAPISTGKDTRFLDNI